MSHLHQHAFRGVILQPQEQQKARLRTHRLEQAATSMKTEADSILMLM
jgi:hypothetical protein